MSLLWTLSIWFVSFLNCSTQIYTHYFGWIVGTAGSSCQFLSCWRQLQSPAPDIWLFKSTDQLHLLPCQAHWEKKGLLSWIPTPGTQLICFTRCHFVIVIKVQAQMDQKNPYSCKELGSIKYWKHARESRSVISKFTHKDILRTGIGWWGRWCQHKSFAQCVFLRGDSEEPIADSTDFIRTEKAVSATNN